MASKCMENEIHVNTKCYDVKTSVGENFLFWTWSCYISYKGSFIAEYFLLKDHDLKITEKRNILYFQKLCDKKKAKATNH